MSQNESPISNFSPFVVNTNNVAKELVTAASNYGLKVAELDFNLLDVQTFLKKGDSQEQEVIGDELKELNDPALLADKSVEIRQAYEIEIVLADKDDRFSKLNLSIGANPSMTRLFASIKPGSVIEYFDEIKKELRSFINKRKLRANMLIGIWDEKLSEGIDELVAKVRVNEVLKVDKKITFEAGATFDVIPTTNDNLIFHYKSDKEKSDGDRVDHYNRGFIQAVTQDELLIEYVKAKKGDPGRNCRGEFIEPDEPTISHSPDFNVSDKIDVIDNENSIEYRAKNSGYVVLENNTYDINSEVEVTEISFKTTGSIGAGMDTDVSISVKEADAFKDAIGAGMEVEVNEINVDGNVGNNAKITANKVNIQGQTHQSSYIAADDIQINIHKGKAKGSKVKVTRLEQGVIEGETVEVTQATGGKIIAKEVYIDTLVSHVDIIASLKIEIKNTKGEENTLTISPVLYDEDKEALSENENEIVVQKRKIRALNEEIEKKEKVLSDNATAIVDLKKRLAQYKKSGTQMPASFVTKFKEFQELQKKLVELKSEIKQHEDMVELLAAKSNKFQGDITKAKIINHDTYKGHNEIRFKLIEPELELYLVPRGTGAEKCFMLGQDEETGAYEIVSKCSESDA